MNYEQTIEYLYRQLPMFSRIGVAAYKKDLHNTIALCGFLDNPQNKFKSIHIAGTNGKGSTSHMLAAMLQQAGYKTGLYTSPHIKNFGERIRINGKMINEKFLVDFVQKTMQVTGEIEPSFFELTVAMAFDYFAQEQVDVAVIETGLGGRLDSTNIISPVLSVITNIGYDHMNLLGSNLSAIAFEKAGIIKPATPAIVGEYNSETRPVFESKAAEVHAPLFFTQDEFSVLSARSTGPYLECAISRKPGTAIQYIRSGLTGTYQQKNFCCVLHAVDILNKIGFSISETAIQRGLEQVKQLTGIRGRWDVIQSNPSIILDVAHNEDGIRQVLKQLETDYPAANIHFVLGFVNDKDIGKILGLFPSGGKYYFTNAHIPRALSYENLQQLARSYNLQGSGYDNVNDAIEKARSQAGKNDVIMVCGSFFIIAEVADPVRLPS